MYRSRESSEQLELGEVRPDLGLRDEHRDCLQQQRDNNIDGDGDGDADGDGDILRHFL